MLEFAFVLPFFLLFIVFSINIGVLIVQHGALQHATNAAARAGAQLGGAQINDVSRVVFNQTASDIPGVRGTGLDMRIDAGHRCAQNGRDRDVVISSTYEAPMTIPGMAGLMRITGSDPGQATGFTLSASAVARCEVVTR